jgi:uncharacterized protein YuzB (UPF0349 family)
MFYCKYCNNERDDSLVGVEYKCSIKCDICVRRGTQLKNSKKKCDCGVSYTNNVTTHKAHLKSVNHNVFLNRLNIIVNK